jgi:hypothetical protein
VCVCCLVEQVVKKENSFEFQLQWFYREISETEKRRKAYLELNYSNSV